MVLKWVKENIIGDFAEERRKYEAERAAKAEEQRPQAPVEQAPDAKPQRKLKTKSFSTRDFDLLIVGESNYQGALSRAKEGVKDYAGKGYIKTILAREPDNQYDSNAVKVMTEDLQTIGYLSRENAKKYHAAVELWEGSGYLIHCKARLSGGGQSKSIGAWLDLGPPSMIEGTFHNPKTRK